MRIVYSIIEFITRFICCCALVHLFGGSVVVSSSSIVRLEVLVKLSLLNLVKMAFLLVLGIGYV